VPDRSESGWAVFRVIARKREQGGSRRSVKPSTGRRRRPMPMVAPTTRVGVFRRKDDRLPNGDQDGGSGAGTVERVDDFRRAGPVCMSAVTVLTRRFWRRTRSMASRRSHRGRSGTRQRRSFRNLTSTGDRSRRMVKSRVPIAIFRITRRGYRRVGWSSNRPVVFFGYLCDWLY